MGWNDDVIQEYEDMLTGEVWQAMEFDRNFLPDDIAREMIMDSLELLESRNFEAVRVDPNDVEYLSYDDVIYLHTNRIACVLWAERQQIFPWRLADRSLAELQHLLSWRYQGFVFYNTGYLSHFLWDVRPGRRVEEAVSLYALFPILALIGLIDIGDIPGEDEELIYYLVERMRASGWRHMTGQYGEYQGYTDHGFSGWDYDTVSQIRRTGCHMISSYLVSLLRSFNIPAHVGPGWDSLPLPDDLGSYLDAIHKSTHCFIHFSSIGSWFYHGDNLYNYLLMTLPVEFSFRDEIWIRDHFLNVSQYEHLRTVYYEEYLFWCLFLGRSEKWFADVRYLYYNDQLRNRLETLHLDLYDREGSPDEIPPIFTPEEVDGLMNWVAKKIAQEEN